MKVLVDTSVWSLLFRKKHKTPEDDADIASLNELIINKDVVMMGAIRQEVLSGIKEQKHFDILKQKLDHFEDILLTKDDFILGASCFNACRSKGIQGSQIDYLICAIAMNHNLEIFTLDKDFQHYQKAIDISLYQYFRLS